MAEEEQPVVYQQANARILIEPRFYFDVGMVDFFMKDVTNTDAVNSKLIEFLHQIFPDLPLTAFSRNTNTNFYFIDSGRRSLSNSDINIFFFEKISTFNEGQHDIVIIDTAMQGHSNLETTLRFNIFNDLQEGLSNSGGEPIESIDEITDEELEDENFRQQLIDTGTDLSHLNYDHNNSLTDVFLNTTFFVGANFTESDVEESNFQNAQLICANFTNSEMPQSSFESSDLRYANFSNVNSYEVEFQRANLKHANFVGANIGSIQCYKAKFQHSNCRGAIFNYGDFRKANFSGADLTDADFRGEGTNLAGADFRGAILENTKFHGTNWEESIYDDQMTDADHDTEFINENDHEDEHQQEPPQEQVEEGPQEPPTILPSLPQLNPYTLINNSAFTYLDIIKMLNPAIKNVILPASKMEVHKWYRVSDMGDTPINVWNESGVQLKRDQANNIIEPKKLDLEKSFKCLQVPDEMMCEGFVYESTPDCMAIHELSAKLNIHKLMENFSLIVGNEEIVKEIKKHYTPPITNTEFLQSLMAILRKVMNSLLNKHNAEDGAEGWTNIYDQVAQRNSFINHALYHHDEGLIKHPFLDPVFNGNPTYLLYLILFLNTLPIQIRVYWAQNYMMQFITGYGQTLETFDPTRKMPPYNFIASCINGNFEKLFLSIGGAIAHFINGNLIVESEEEKQENLKKILAKNVEAEFETYYGTSEDPTVEGYEKYLQEKAITADFTEEKKAKYLTILTTDASVRSKLKCFVHRISGGGSGRKRKGRKYTLKKYNTKKQNSSSLKIKNRKFKKGGLKTKKQVHKKNTLKKYKKKKSTINLRRKINKRKTLKNL